MPIRTVATTDTVNTFRTTFNSLGTDVGDLSGLSTSNKTSIVAAINETYNNPKDFILRDSALNQTTVSSNDVINVTGSTGITAVVSTDTLTISTDLSDILTGLTFATVDTDKFLVADGNTLKYRTGNEIRADIGAIAGVTFNVRSYTGDGTQTSFGVTVGQSTATIIVTENGIVQRPTTDYSVVSNNCIFTSAPDTGNAIQIRELIIT
jgi:hypothetical protein